MQESSMGVCKEINMKRIVVYVHGKGGSAAEAGHYKPLRRPLGAFGGAARIYSERKRIAGQRQNGLYCGAHV